MNLKQQWTGKGYDAEELYFEKVNRELIEQLKKSTHQKTSAETTETQTAEVIQLTPRTNKKAA